jgi:hypothetical protein
MGLKRMKKTHTVTLPALLLSAVPLAVALAVELSVVDTGGAIENSELVS